jgi:RHS repeat-associated protein
MAFTHTPSSEVSEMHPSKRRAWAAPVSLLLALSVFLSGLMPRSVLADTSVTYLYNDASGTTLAAADESGEVLWRRAYAPFGEEYDVSGDTAQAAMDPRGYGGHTLDRNTDLIYMGARYYNPRLGLFYSRDPQAVDAGEPITFNRYIYANQNPYAYVDPDGELPILIPLVIWGAGMVMTGVETYQTYQAEGAKAAATSLAVDVGISMVTGGAGVLAKRLYTLRKQMGRRKKDKSQCFVAGTPVHLSTGIKAIEDVAAGDLVWARNERTGGLELREVVQTFVTEDQELLGLEVEDEDGVSELFQVTPEHPLWARERGWVAAGDVQPGEQVMSLAGGWLRVTGATWMQVRDTVYNFEVDGHHNYFVGELGLWAHNECSGGGEGSASRRYDRPAFEEETGRAVREKDATNDWDDFLGPDQTNIDPRDGLPDADRIWSADGKRSIRYGEHEYKDRKPGKHHYHKETWYPDKVVHTKQNIQK